MKLIWHNYRYYPYERELARRESAALLAGAPVSETIDGLHVDGPFDPGKVKRLTYFSGFKNGQSFTHTTQDLLEGPARSGKNRQATRYSVHGLHEYRGKFNPQVAKSLLNIFGVQPGDIVLDPFCGSGTTLAECAHIGVRSLGTDLNPLAVYISNAKMLALTTPVAELRSASDRIAGGFRDAKTRTEHIDNDQRTHYLGKWFEASILHTIELTRTVIGAEAGHLAPVFLVIASNLLRDYSNQDPHDLRIRRRKSPIPSRPFVETFLSSIEQMIQCLYHAQLELDGGVMSGEAILCDVANLTPQVIPGPFNAAITSPPYAMALPYIDTQRLSLVWLQLLSASQIQEIDASLIGSREIRGDFRRKAVSALQTNAANLPAREAVFCGMLQWALGDNDGFRRKAVPQLLYRYFAGMQKSFTAIRSVMKPRAPFGLIVGHNHTVLGGVRYDIDTPAHLASLATNAGWGIEEVIDLQTYQRYGYHMNNAVSAESLVILRA